MYYAVRYYNCDCRIATSLALQENTSAASCSVSSLGPAMTKILEVRTYIIKKYEHGLTHLVTTDSIYPQAAR